VFEIEKADVRISPKNTRQRFCLIIDNILSIVYSESENFQNIGKEGGTKNLEISESILWSSDVKHHGMCILNLKLKSLVLYFQPGAQH